MHLNSIQLWNDLKYNYQYLAIYVDEIACLTSLPSVIGEIVFIFEDLSENKWFKVRAIHSK